MAPAAKKGKSGKNNADRRSLSRHSTPVSALTDVTAPPTPATPSTTAAPSTSMAKETPYLHTPTAALISQDPSIEAHIDKSNGSSSKAGDPPSARELHKLHDTIRDTVNRFMGKRGEVCDRSMRQLVQRRKERLQEEREQEAARAAAESARVKREHEASKKGKGTPHKKRSHDEMELDSAEKERKVKIESLPSVGAHGLARQDGVGVHQGADAPPSPPVPAGTVVPELMDTADSPADSDTTQQDPTQIAPLYERIYGKDPTAVEDPLIYDIRDIDDDMSEAEKREILQVAQWPSSDLRDKTAGDPPDADFSNAKPANQVNFSTFQGYIEPYIRAFTEEDAAFLKERGDRHAPYVIPQRGLKDYKDVWQAEDGGTGLEPPKRHINNPNEARGSMEDMEDDIADQDTISMGPIMSRLNSLIRPAPTGARKDDTEDANGDVSMVNGDDDTTTALPNGNADEQKPVLCLPAEAPKPPNLPAVDYDSLENRALAELKYLGMIGPNETTNFDAREDDEVSARLRTLQHELRRVSRLNNIRKARVLELTEERMSMQEYSNIADDLDNQVNAAYLKRNRSLAKPNQKKGGGSSRPGQKGVASAPVGRGVSDGVRALMNKRMEWVKMVGPVVNCGRPPIPGDTETVFDEASLKRFERLEKEAELGEVEGE